MAKIKLINENGVIKGIDPETGEEVPVEFEDLETQSVSTEEALIGKTNPYQYVSESHTTVTVPGDYDTIQEAIDDCPKNLRHEYVIDVDNGAYDEDLVFRGIANQGYTGAEASTGGIGTDGEHGIIQIVGDTTTPSNVKINSVTAIGCTGVQAPTLWGVELNGASPHVDEDTTAVFSGCQQAFLGDCNFRGGANKAVTAYGGNLHVRNMDVGADNYDIALYAKRQAAIHERNTSGSVTDRGYVASDASSIHSQHDSNISSPNRKYDPVSGSYTVIGPQGINFQNVQLLGDAGGLEINDRVGSVPFILRDLENGVERFRAEGKGYGNSHIENLSGQTGDFDGQVRLDDGSNTPHRGVECVWDDVNGVWVDQTDGSTFT